MNIDAGEVELIGQWNARLAQPVSLRFIRTQHSATSAFDAFLERVREIAPRIEVLSEKGEAAEPPVIEIGKTLRYHAIPTGSELEPFLEAVSMLLASQSKPSAGTSEPSKRIGPLEGTGKVADAMDLPAQIKIYVSSHCPFCPRVLKEIQPLAFTGSFLVVTVIDGALFPEMAEKDGVRSAPTTILDSGMRWTGLMRPEELRNALAYRDPSQLSAETLKNFVKEGNAGRLAEMMLQRNLVFPAFLELLLHPEWSVRLGAMVTAEEIGERNPKLGQELLPGLWERMESEAVQDSIRGDIVYLIGTLGSQEWIPRLERFLANSQSEDLREIAEEALQKIGGAVNG